MKKILLNDMYEIFLLKSSIEIKMKQKSTKERLVIIAFSLFICAICAFPLVLGIIKNMPFYSIIFSLVIVLIILGLTFGIVFENRRIRVFQFIIDEKGVRHVDVNKTYFLNWDEIACWGFVRNNSVGGIRRRENHVQTCIFFSKISCDNNSLKKQFDRVSNRRYEHASSKNIIALALGQKDDRDIYNLFVEFVSPFCNNILEID